MWSISASVSRTPATGAARTPSRALGRRAPRAAGAGPARRWPRNHGPLRAADRERRLRPRAARRFPCARPRTSGSGSSTAGSRRRRQSRGSERAPTDDRNRRDLRSCTRRSPLGSMNVELTTASRPRSRPTSSPWPPDGLARARARRALRRAPGALGGRRRSVAVVQVGRELRARRVAARRARRARPGGPADGRGPGRARGRGGGTVAWALDDTLPMAEYRQVQAVVEGAVLGGYDAGRWKSDGAGTRASSASSSAARGAEHARDRGARRGRRALDERRPRARRRAAERHHARRPRRARGERCPACASRCSTRSPPASPRSRPSAARAREPPRLIVLRHEPAERRSGRASRSSARPSPSTRAATSSSRSPTSCARRATWPAARRCSPRSARSPSSSCRSPSSASSRRARTWSAPTRSGRPT